VHKKDLQNYYIDFRNKIKDADANMLKQLEAWEIEKHGGGVYTHEVLKKIKKRC
jgi:hypothetical protein